MVITVLYSVHHLQRHEVRALNPLCNGVHLPLSIVKAEVFKLIKVILVFENTSLDIQERHHGFLDSRYYQEEYSCTHLLHIWKEREKNGWSKV